jgi:hypothetical protein
VRFNLSGLSIFLISAPKDVQQVLSNVYTFSDYSLRARFTRNVLGVPHKGSEVIRLDNSGLKLDR